MGDFVAALTGSQIEEHELPPVAFFREASPDAEPGTVLVQTLQHTIGAKVRAAQRLVSSFTQAARARALDRVAARREGSPAAAQPQQHQTTSAPPAAGSKRSRSHIADRTVEEQQPVVPQPEAEASPVTAGNVGTPLEILLTSSSLEDIQRDRSVTVADLRTYLEEKEEPLPAQLRKAELAKVAKHVAETRPTTTSTSIPQGTAVIAGTPDKVPTMRWTLAKMDEFAAQNRVRIPPGAIKFEIYELLLAHVGSSAAEKQSRTSAA